MTEPNGGGEPTEPLAHVGHPKGTLAVLVIYMLLFILGWAALYFGEFLPRGTPDGNPNETTVHGEAHTP
ncbi:MAG TPA: hypothetical protein VKU40_16735 [Thermoanaerobaculia bacterium]|nr:hypothetical protein [Thermoanaerobaculia bacterium]